MYYLSLKHEPKIAAYVGESDWCRMCGEKIYVDDVYTTHVTDENHDRYCSKTCYLRCFEGVE